MFYRSVLYSSFTLIFVNISKLFCYALAYISSKCEQMFAFSHHSTRYDHNNPSSSLSGILTHNVSCTPYNCAKSIISFFIDSIVLAHSLIPTAFVLSLSLTSFNNTSAIQILSLFSTQIPCMKYSLAILFSLSILSSTIATHLPPC